MRIHPRWSCLAVWLMVSMSCPPALHAQGQQNQGQDSSAIACNWSFPVTFFSVDTRTIEADPGNPASKPRTVTDIKFLSEATKGAPVMLYFRQPDLADDKVHPCFLSSKELADLSTNSCNFVLIDFKMNHELVEYFNVSSTPSLVFLSPDGYEYQRISKGMSAKEIVGAYRAYAPWREAEEKKIDKLRDRYDKELEAGRLRPAVALLVKIVATGYADWKGVKSAQLALDKHLEEGKRLFVENLAKYNDDKDKETLEAIKQLALDYKDTDLEKTIRAEIKKIENPDKSSEPAK